MIDRNVALKIKCHRNGFNGSNIFSLADRVASSDSNSTHSGNVGCEYLGFCPSYSYRTVNFSNLTFIVPDCRHSVRFRICHGLWSRTPMSRIEKRFYLHVEFIGHTVTMLPRWCFCIDGFRPLSCLAHTPRRKPISSLEIMDKASDSREWLVIRIDRHIR